MEGPALALGPWTRSHLHSTITRSLGLLCGWGGEGRAATARARGHQGPGSPGRRRPVGCCTRVCSARGQWLLWALGLASGPRSDCPGPPWRLSRGGGSSEPVTRLQAGRGSGRLGVTRSSLAPRGLCLLARPGPFSTVSPSASRSDRGPLLGLLQRAKAPDSSSEERPGDATSGWRGRRAASPCSQPLAATSPRPPRPDPERREQGRLPSHPADGGGPGQSQAGLRMPWPPPVPLSSFTQEETEAPGQQPRVPCSSHDLSVRPLRAGLGHATRTPGLKVPCRAEAWPSSGPASEDTQRRAPPEAPPPQGARVAVRARGLVSQSGSQCARHGQLPSSAAAASAWRTGQRQSSGRGGKEPACACVCTYLHTCARVSMCLHPTNAVGSLGEAGAGGAVTSSQGTLTPRVRPVRGPACQVLRAGEEVTRRPKGKRPAAGRRGGRAHT